MNGMLRDLGFAARMMRRRPGLTLVTLLVLGLGIGGNVAVFSVMDALLLRAPAVGHPERLVRVGARWLEERRSSNVSYPDYQDLRAARNVFSGLAAWAVSSVALSGDGAPETLHAHLVSDNYFDVLAVPMALGAGFAGMDASEAAAQPAVVLGESLWRRRFGADPGILKRTITLNGRSFAVAGIAPDRFSGLEMGEPADVFIPLPAVTTLRPDGARLLDDRGACELTLVGRLADGVGRDQSAAAVAALAAGLAQDDPAAHGLEGDRPAAWTLTVAPLRGGIRADARGEAASLAFLLAGVSVMVLLIACANVAALLLGRSAERAQEIEVRRALGATRARLVRQMLTESLLLAVSAGAVSAILAVWGLQSLLTTLGVTHDLAVAAAPGARVLLYAATLSIVTGLLFGAIPALQATRPALFRWAPGRVPGGQQVTRRSRSQALLVIGQVTLSMILLVSAGMLLSGLRRALQEPPGFEAGGVVTVSFDTGLLGYDRDRSVQMQRRLLERASALPGVTAASVSSLVPLSGTMAGNALYTSPGDGGGEMMVHFADVWPGFFETLRIPIRMGRGFGPADRDGSPGAAIVSETLARRLWPESDPLGRQVRLGSPDAAPLTVVGVAGDIRWDELDETPGPFVYLCALQSLPFRSEAALLVRTGGQTAALLEQLRHEVAALEPNLPLIRPGTLEIYRRERADKERGASLLLSVSGMLALVLAALGLHGVMACAVARRTRETGIRLAVGARPEDIARAFLKEGARLAMAGIVAGSVAGAILSRLLMGIVFGLAPADVLVYLVAGAVLAVSAILASWIPARRAAALDPMAALREP
jgi:putative ABC transport system permease protein